MLSSVAKVIVIENNQKVLWTCVPSQMFTISAQAGNQR